MTNFTIAELNILSIPKRRSGSSDPSESMPVFPGMKSKPGWLQARPGFVLPSAVPSRYRQLDLKSLSLSQETEDVNLRIQVYLCAVNYFAWTGDLARYNLAAEAIRKMAQASTASPLLLIVWKWIEALVFNRTTESSGMVLESITDDLKVADTRGFHVWDHMLFAQGVYAVLKKGDPDRAVEFLRNMAASIDPVRSHGV
jgi:hypothetical protein